jgi:glutamyl-tRNA reductase
VQLVTQIFEQFDELKVVVLGSGQMAELVLLHLKARGAQQITIVNRTYSKAQELADRFEAQAVQLDALERLLMEADVVIGSLAVEAPVLSRSDVARCLKRQKQGPLFFIDLGVPRNFSPNIKALSNVFLYDIDHLGEFVARNQEFRKEAARDADIIIDYGIIQFEKWLAKLRSEPESLRLRSQILKICSEEVGRTFNKAGLVMDPNRQSELVHRLGQKLAHQMTEALTEQSIERVGGSFSSDSEWQVPGLPVAGWQLLGLHFDELLDLDG